MTRLITHDLERNPHTICMGEIPTDLGDNDKRTGAVERPPGGAALFAAGGAIYCEQFVDPARPLFWDPNTAVFRGGAQSKRGYKWADA